MKLNYLRAGVASASALLLLSGCMDDNYDLSDIDTTTELKVNDLVIPVNLASITLDNVMDIDEDDPDATIKYVTVDGKDYFAIEKGGVKDGTFHADPTHIEPVKATKPSVEPIEQDLTGSPYTTGASTSKKAPGVAMLYNINEDKTTFSYDMDDVDEAIKTVEEIRMGSEKLVMNLTLHSPSVSQSADHVEFHDLVLQLPEGMKVTCPGGEGVVKGNKVTVAQLKGTGNQAHLQLISDDINFVNKVNTEGITVNNRHFDFQGDIEVLEGKLIVYPKSNADLGTDAIKFFIDYDLSAFTVTEFNGRVDYKTEIVDIDPVDLSDLPDFLAGDDTNLIMKNPQITLTVNNPAADYNLSCFSGLSITAQRPDQPDETQALPASQKLVIGHDKGEGPYTLVIAPNPTEAINVSGPNRSNYQFPGLSYILAGKGLPEHLEIELANNSYPEPRLQGNAKNFPLGQDLDAVDGNYTFFTLLALADGSRIVYEKTDDGWNDEDVDAIAISSFTISATATTDLPCGVTLWARPVDKEGKDIAITNPESATASITAEAKDEPFSITMTGDIRHLDGIHFIATVDGFNGESLTPAQSIKLDNLKAKVTGTYTKKL